MQVEVQEVTYNAIEQYIQQQNLDGIPEWEETVLDKRVVRTMLVNGSYARNRKAHALVRNDEIIGYAVVDNSEKSLDLLHLSPEIRGKGLAEWFLRGLDVEEVVVDTRNKRALGLYKKLGYEITYC